jgi:hypothetical protein
MDETIYVDNRIHLKFDEVNNNIMLWSYVTSFIQLLGFLVANVAYIKKIVVRSNCNFEFFFY